jgi:ubiquinone/menaquinone biosynthesis C-methylase UbiE
MSNDTWYIWNHDKTYQDTMQKRASGELPEMESAKALCEVLKPYYKKGMNLADIGCGGGHYLRSLRTRLDPEISYTGVDATESYIRMAKEAFPGVLFQVGDVYELPFEDSSFDIVTCCNLVSFLPPPPITALEELIRITRKHIIVRVTIGTRNYIIKEIRSSQDGLGETVSEQQLVTADGQLKLFHYHNMYTEAYYREVLGSLDPTLNVSFVVDNMWQAFDNREHSNATGTRVVGQHQVAGNLLLDWRFIVITKS